MRRRQSDSCTKKTRARNMEIRKSIDSVFDNGQTEQSLVMSALARKRIRIQGDSLFLNLPDEIIQSGILTWLTVKEHMRVLSVSKLLYFLSNSEHSWPASLTIRDPPSDFFQTKAFLVKSVRLVMSRPPKGDDFKQLRHLDLDEFELLMDCDYAARFGNSDDWLFYLKKGNLRRLSLYSTGTKGWALINHCHEMSSLTQLVLIENDKIFRNEAAVLLRSLKTLQHLKMRLTNQWTGYFGNVMDSSVLGEINPTNHPGLKSMSIPYCKNIGDFEILSFFVGVQWQSLVHVDISASSITDRCLEMVVPSLGGLKCLFMNKCKEITSNGVKHLVGAKSLELLEIRYCHMVDDQCLDVLQEMTQKQRLRIVRCKGSLIHEGLPFLSFHNPLPYSFLSMDLPVQLCAGCCEFF